MDNDIYVYMYIDICWVIYVLFSCYIFYFYSIYSNCYLNRLWWFIGFEWNKINMLKENINKGFKITFNLSVVFERIDI